MKTLLFLALAFTLVNCKSEKEEQPAIAEPSPVQVKLETAMGNVVIELSDKTPLHRDNFIKIVNEGRLDSMLFHRVLEGFVVQAGLYDSLTMAAMDSVELEAVNYRIPAEMDSTLFHKRGALGAARTGNPDRESSSLSFYVVHRGPRVDSLIDVDQDRINTWLQQYYFLQDPSNSSWKDSLNLADQNEDWETFSRLSDTINKLADTFTFEYYDIPEDQREIYRKQGGTPHLDQNYTVFGEVISGMTVIDSIAKVAVNEAGMPDQPVYIHRAEVVKSE
ncbi:peptidylprolyl isomerase [Aureitalea marina]|uniref:peptidylprolyl isomerase n=1 Tax=Aureitalea marina TaxID=930804 RepID=A0A2S7KNL6_9FLAO|nr:peptidylprolyl isomerase [Aureitalea marina]PQB04178.1 hypothetical protein BST85_04125 [Aureitalea marina]